MEEYVLKVENIYKKFTTSLKRSMYYGSQDVLKNLVGISYDTTNLRKGEFWALENINFDLKKGESMGIIGQNGSGKSTLLRLINGIYPPNRGKIMVNGTIGALIAVGAGFHPHMTGRENIYLNGTIMGMTTKEIEEKFDDIISFADIGDFIDAPVATYSSGMSIRLGFAIAIHSEPEILLADEILAVGDLSFALKCYRKIAEYRKNGGSIVLVSHSMQLIRNTCDKVIWIDKGKVKDYGNTQSICDDYEKFMLQKDVKEGQGLGTIVNNDPTVHISSVEFMDGEGKKKVSFEVGEEFRARIHYSTSRKVKNPMFTIGILNAESILVIGNYSNYDMSKQLESLEGEGHIDFEVKKLLIKPGSYNCTVTLAENDLANVLDWHEKNYMFNVVSNGDVAYGLLQLPSEWTNHNEDYK
ncbi:MAG: ABC transporter ATP-binding protein [Candidatus Dojkabacteria bacterium]